MAKRWYSVSVLSNFEKKIAEQIRLPLLKLAFRTRSTRFWCPGRGAGSPAGQEGHVRAALYAGLCAGAHGNVEPWLPPDLLDQPRDGLPGAAGPPMPMRDAEVNQILNRVEEGRKHRAT